MFTQVSVGDYIVENVFQQNETAIINMNISSDFNGNTFFQEANVPLDVPTYDGSGQLTHPSVLYFPNEWNGHNYWAVATPYPYGDDKYENPSIYCFDIPGENWTVPKEQINPLVSEPSKGFNSDPCMAYDNKSSELIIFYRDYNYTTQVVTYLIIKSPDGISWSEPIFLYSIKGNKPCLTRHMPLLNQIYVRIHLLAYNAIHTNAKQGATNIERSNAIIQLPNGTWMMWAQKWDSPYSIIYRTSSDSIQWSEPKDCIFDDSFDDGDVWHIEVKYIPEYMQFIMVLYSNIDGNLTLAESTNGIEWKYFHDSILEPSIDGTNFANMHLYKSSITYEPLADTLHLWYSGVNTEHEWRIGYTNSSYP
jgi:hypothetical protein